MPSLGGWEWVIIAVVALVLFGGAKLANFGKNAGKARVRPELQALIDFQQINLLAPDWPVPGNLIAIFCRNVMIYFDRPTQFQILSRFAPLLGPSGLLFAGHSESFNHASKLFRLHDKTIYERITTGR